MSNKHDIREMLDALRNDHSGDDDEPGFEFASSHRSSGTTGGSVRSHEDDEHEEDEHEEDEHDEHDEHLSGADDDAVAAPAGTTADTGTVTVTDATAGVATGGTTGTTGTTTGSTGTTTDVSATDAAATSGVTDDDLDGDDIGDDDLDSEDDDDASAAAGESGVTATDTGVAGTVVTNAPGHHGEHGHEHSIRALLEKFLGQSLDDDNMGLMGTLMPLLNAAQNAGGGEGHGRNALLEFGTLDQFVNWLHEIEAGATTSDGESPDLSGAAIAVEHQLVIVGLIAEPISF